MSWLKKIEGFTSISEVERFEKYLSDRVREGELKEVEPEEHYFGDDTFNKDQWFKDQSSTDVLEIGSSRFSI